MIDSSGKVYVKGSHSAWVLATISAGSSVAGTVAGPGVSASVTVTQTGMTSIDMHGHSCSASFGWS